MENYILAYYQKICDGSEIVGKWIRLLYEIIVAGIEDGTYIYDAVKANKVIRFYEKYVRHNKGILAPQVIKLELWEKASLSLIFGIVDENGHRQFKEVAWFIGRKMGKTIIASGIIDFVAYVDGEFGSEIYCVAPKLDQSDLVFSAFEFTKDRTQAFARRTKKRKSDYLIPESNTTIKKIAFNEKKADGYNPMLVVADEMSSWPAARGLKQYEVLVSGSTAREEPLFISISSGGYVEDGIYDELYSRGTRFLLGNSKEKRLLPIFYMIDDPKKWDDINELKKSLPGLGVSVKVKTILEEIDIARESLSKKAEFLTKYCNLKQNSTQAWLDALVIERSFGEALNLEDYKDCYCVGGIDLSQTTDLTCCIAVIEKNNMLNVFAQFFMPTEKLEEAIQRDGIPYNIYVQKGFLKLSGDNFVDYKDCENWFYDLVKKYKVYPLWTGYDRYSAQYMVAEMKQNGFHLDDVYQGFNLSPVIKEMEGTIKDGRFNFGNNDLLKIHLFNSALKTDNESNKVKLVKISPKERIDGCAALLDALCVRQKYWSEIGHQLENKGK